MSSQETITINLSTGKTAIIRGYLTARDRIAISTRNNEESIIYAAKSLLLSFDGRNGDDAYSAFMDSRSAEDFDAVLNAMVSLAQGGGDAAKK